MPSLVGSEMCIRDSYNTFPSINFDFNAEKVYRLHPQDYFLKNDEYSYCIGIHPLKDMILGGLFWRNYDIKIDKKNKTVSFVRADCAGTNEVIDTRGNDVKQNIIDNPHNADWTIKNVATKYTNTRSWGVIIALIIILILFLLVIICLIRCIL